MMRHFIRILKVLIFLVTIANAQKIYRSVKIEAIQYNEIICLVIQDNDQCEEATVQIDMYDMLLCSVMHTEMYSKKCYDINEVCIPTSNMSNGVYYLYVRYITKDRSDEKVKVQKIILSR